MNERDRPIFLGISRRAARSSHEWNLIGLSTLIVLPFFPQKLTGSQCVIAIHRDLLRSNDQLSYRIVFTDESDATRTAWVDQTIFVETRESDGQIALNPAGFSVTAELENEGPKHTWNIWPGEGRPGSGAYELWPLPAPPLIVRQPCRILVDLEVADERFRLGEFLCAFAPPKPLTSEERRAIASRLNAPNAVQINIGCTDCKDELEVYTPLNPGGVPPRKINPTAIDISAAPQQWQCRCGKQEFDLTYLKQGLHDLLRRQPSSREGVSPLHFAPLYEYGRIETLLAEYESLISSSPNEEMVQKFLEQNPLFWAFLSPTKILHKPSVLTRKKADFGILTAQRILYLVEIEKPTTRLVNKDGSISAEIQRGANQIHDWSLVVDDHRLSLLSELGLKEEEVREIRYVLVGGIARNADSVGLTKLRRSPLVSKTQFYCFDELGSFLHAVAGELREL